MIGARIAAAVFPERCRGCGRSGAALCADCLGPRGAHHALPGLARVASASIYCGLVRSVILDAKFRGRYRALDAFIPRLVALASSLPPCAVVVAPPPAPEHLRVRGFDPGGYLARRVARALGVECAAPLVRYGAAQTGRNRAARLAGPSLAARARVPGRVLLVDDVVTTGATMATVAAVLRRVGAEVVVGLAAARGPDPVENGVGPGVRLRQASIRPTEHPAAT